MPDIMGAMDIAFPNLNIYLENVPKSFTVFGFTIALYGVIIGCGFLLALLLISKIAEKTGQKADDYWDIAVYIICVSTKTHCLSGFQGFTVAEMEPVTADTVSENKINMSDNAEKDTENTACSSR